MFLCSALPNARLTAKPFTRATPITWLPPFQNKNMLSADLSPGLPERSIQRAQSELFRSAGRAYGPHHTGTEHKNSTYCEDYQHLCVCKLWASVVRARSVPGPGKIEPSARPKRTRLSPMLPTRS